MADELATVAGADNGEASFFLLLFLLLDWTWIANELNPAAPQAGGPLDAI